MRTRTQAHELISEFIFFCFWRAPYFLVSRTFPASMYTPPLAPTRPHHRSGRRCSCVCVCELCCLTDSIESNSIHQYSFDRVKSFVHRPLARPVAATFSPFNRPRLDVLATSEPATTRQGFPVDQWSFLVVDPFARARCGITSKAFIVLVVISTIVTGPPRIAPPKDQSCPTKFQQSAVIVFTLFHCDVSVDKG